MGALHWVCWGYHPGGPIICTATIVHGKACECARVDFDSKQTVLCVILNLKANTLQVMRGHGSFSVIVNQSLGP
jgi:hypothetical protein